MNFNEVEKKYCAVFIDEENVRGWLTDKKGMSNRKTIRDYFDIDDFFNYLRKKGFIITTANCYISVNFKGFAGIYSYLYDRGVQVIPFNTYNSKSLLDSTMIVDFLSTAYEQSHIETFFIVSGDKDYYPPALKLKEMGKEVIFIGSPDSSADLIKSENVFKFIDVTQFINKAVMNHRFKSSSEIASKTSGEYKQGITKVKEGGG